MMVKLFANLMVNHDDEESEPPRRYTELVEYSFTPRLGEHRLWFAGSNTVVTGKTPGKIVSALTNHDGVDYRSCEQVVELIEWLVG